MVLIDAPRYGARMIATVAGASFATLSPDLIVDAVEAAGFPTDGRVLALGSYENRVYQVGLEGAGPGGGPVPVFRGFRFAIYPRRGGQWPELGTPDERQWIGRFLGRIHLVGGAGRFVHRPPLSVPSSGRGSGAPL